ncbi:hypothetical protein JCM16358_03860 [Halanaerocella petrolearia]
MTQRWNYYFKPIVIIVLFSLILTGCTETKFLSQENDTKETLDLKDPNLALMAYQLDHQMRSLFRAAYQSYINLERITETDSDNFDQVLSVLRMSLKDFVVEDQIKEQIKRLKISYQGGEGEFTFPSHEVVKKAKVINQEENTVQVRLNITRYYPKRAWTNERYNKTFSYVVTLLQEDDTWKIKDINNK